jgi:hypothetical protein
LPGPALPPPAASFIIPVYNGEAFLAEAIASCFSQTVPDVEVVAVDDGSTDGSAALLLKLQAQYGPRLVVVQQANRGVSAARNTGIRASTGPVVLYLDCDDLAPPERVALSLSLLETGADIIYGQEEEFIEGQDGPRKRTAGIRQIDRGNAVQGCGFRTGTVAARRSLHLERGVWLDETMAGAEDYELSLAALASGATLKCSPDVLLWRRNRPDSLRARCDWGPLRNYAVLKHADFLARYTSAPVPVSAEQAEEVRRLRTAAATMKPEAVETVMPQTTPAEFIIGTAEQIADRLQTSLAADLVLVTPAAATDAWPNDRTDFARLLSCLADPSVGAAAPLFRESVNSDQKASVRAEGYLRTRQPLAGCLALRRWVLEAVGGFDETWGEAWPLFLCEALLRHHYRLLIDRGLLIEGKATVPKRAVAAFQKSTGCKLADLPACYPDPLFTAVVTVPDGSPEAYTKRTLEALLAAAPAEDLEVVLVGATGFPVSGERVIPVLAPALACDGYNRGVRRGLGKYVLLLKSGDTLDAAYLAAVMRQLETAEVAVHAVTGAGRHYGQHLAGVATRRSVFMRHGLWLTDGRDEGELGEQLTVAARRAGLSVVVSEHGPAVQTGRRIILRGFPKTATVRWDKTPLVFISTCSLTVTGGGQRPAQMARAAAADGHPVIFFNDNHQLEWAADNLLACNQEALLLLAEDLRDRAGTAIYGLPDLAAWVHPFGDRWRGVFDFCDDWEEFAKVGHLPAFDLNQYRQVLLEAPLVVCSAQRLVDIAEAHGSKNAILVRNGGPDRPLTVEQYPRPEDFLDGDLKVCFIGSTWGKWLDWSALGRLAKDLQRRGGVINIIGGNYSGQMPTYANVRWHGELSYHRAMAFAVHSDVGIVPFCNEKICASVDPVKYYDYVAAGCRVVATEVLTEMKGRDYCRLAPAEELAAAVVRSAEEPRLTLAQRARFCQDNSWHQRMVATFKALKKLPAPEVTR